MNMYWLLSAVFFVFFAGVFDAAQTIRKDAAEFNKIHDYLCKTGDIYNTESKAYLWYWGMGGNAVWNPALPSIPFMGIWCADYWHTMKHGWIICFSIAIGCASLVNMNLWQAAVLAFVMNFIEGTTFQLFYGNIFARGVDFNFWRFIKERNPFHNPHAQ